MNSNERNNSGRLIGGTILIGIGVLALLGNMFQFDVWHYLWPFFIIGFGLAFFAGMWAGGKATGGLAIPGTIFTLTGLLLLFQNTFNHFDSWAYAWALVAPTGVGIGLLIFSWWSDKAELVRPGRILIMIGLILFLIGGFFYEFSVGIFAFTHAGNVLGPLLLILIGVVLLLSRGFFWMIFPSQKPATNPPSQPNKER